MTSSLASSSWDKSVRVWDVFGRSQKSENLVHSKDVLALSFRPDGRELCTSTIAGDLVVWRREWHPCALSLPSLPPPPPSLSLSLSLPSLRVGVFAKYENPNTLALLSVLLIHFLTLPCSFGTWSWGRFSTPLRDAMTWQVADPQIRCARQKRPWQVRSSARSIFSWNENPYRHSLNTWLLGKAFTSLCYSPDGKCVLAGGGSKYLCLYDTEMRALVRKVVPRNLYFFILLSQPIPRSPSAIIAASKVY